MNEPPLDSIQQRKSSLSYYRDEAEDSHSIILRGKSLSAAAAVEEEEEEEEEFT